MDDLSQSFTWYADWAEDVSPLYERLARATAEDCDLLDVAAEASSGQPSPQLLLAAVHALLLREPEHRLAAFYPTCTDDPVDPATTDPFPAFREFCLANEGRIREIVSSRRVQTNAVGRSAVLFPAFTHVAAAGSQLPLALVVPDQQRRHRRLESAIELVRDDPPRLRAGDAVAVLPDVLPAVPDDLELCAFSTHTLYQLNDEQRTSLRETLVEHSDERPVHWLSNDPRAESDDMTYQYTRLCDGVEEKRQLAEYESYGEWIRWLAAE